MIILFPAGDFVVVIAIFVSHTPWQKVDAAVVVFVVHVTVGDAMYYFTYTRECRTIFCLFLGLAECGSAKAVFRFADPQTASSRKRHDVKIL